MRHPPHRLAARRGAHPGNSLVAGGAATVLGSLWQVMDRRTALLMFAVHHHLRADGMPTDEALRRGQLWMLDPARRPIPDMPPVLRNSIQALYLDEPQGW